MIALLPIRFSTNTDPRTVWSETLFRNWMHPAIPYSLGHFWWESGWGYLDINYSLFPETVLSDPRLTSGGTTNTAIRQALLAGCIQAATARYSINWDGFDIAFLWFAQSTDMFGGGTYTVTYGNQKSKDVKTTVVDIDSPFDGAGQELGHSFGFNHELSLAGKDYACPYSVMSARNVREFVRAKDTRLPEGTPIKASGDTFFSIPAERVAGPSLAAAQLYPLDWFRNSPHTVEARVVGYGLSAVIVVYALDHARSLSQTTPLPVLIAWTDPSGRKYMVEFRRPNKGYDQAVTAALVVNSFNPDGRVRYEGATPLPPAGGFVDWVCFTGNFTLRIWETGPGQEFVRFQFFTGIWIELDNNPATQDIVADGSNLYQLHKTGRVWRYTGVPHTGWLELDNNSATRKIAASGGYLYQIHQTGRIWKFTGIPHTGWVELDNNGDSVDIVADGPQLYQLHRTGRIWIYTGTPHTGWLELDNNGDTVKIAASGGNLYQIHRTGRIWRYTGVPHTGWQELDNNPDSVDIVADGARLYQLHKTGRIWIYTGVPHTGWQELDNNPETKQIAASNGSLYQIHASGKIWRYTGTPHTGWFLLDTNSESASIAASPGSLFQLHRTGRIWIHAV